MELGKRDRQFRHNKTNMQRQQGFSRMENSVVSPSISWPHALYAAPAAQAMPGLPASGIDPRDFTAIVVNLLDDARRAVGSDREAAKASIARVTALLRDEAGCSTAETTSAPPAAARGGLAQWQIRRATAHVDANLMSTITVGDLSEITRLSKSHFSRAFRVSLGESVHAYIIRRRMDRARELMLTTDEPLCQIALSCGLSDQAHFSRLFRRAVGSSPSAWRRQWRSEESATMQSSVRMNSSNQRRSAAESRVPLPALRGRFGVRRPAGQEVAV
jgi:AraC family transcriptional regulator